ncbi:MAG TPA: DinB family protein [Thermoanaerobaculia bacterium]|jgi:uncharacterized damage-inducible protein DinB
MTDVARYALDSLRVRITQIFPAQIRACLEQLTDEQIWWRPNEASNSIGNIVLHVTGSLNHFLNRAVGGFPYERDRDAEFSERRPIPRAELLAQFEEMVAKAEQTFANLTVDRLNDPSPNPKMYDVIIEDLLTVGMHLSNHAGQLLWITKMLAGGGIDDLWVKTHKELGGWKKA